MTWMQNIASDFLSLLPVDMDGCCYGEVVDTMGGESRSGVVGTVWPSWYAGTQIM